MKHILIYTALLVIALSSCSGNKSEEKGRKATDTIPLLVTTIKGCSKLYTAEYRIHKIITHNDEKKLKGTFMQKEFDITLPLGERKIAIPMDATLKAYINFDGFSEKNVRRDGERIEIILPDPKVEMTGNRINHKEIKKKVAILRAGFSDAEMAAYEQQGREAIIATIPQMGIIGDARDNAARILIPMIEKMGFKEENITVTFRKHLAADDIPVIFENSSIENGKKQ